MITDEYFAADKPPVRTTPGRWAVTAVFFLNGLTLSTYIVRAPSFKDSYQLSDGRVGLNGLLFSLAALACMQFVGPLTARVGTRSVLRTTLTVMPLVLAGMAVAPSPWWFTVLGTVLGALHGTTDTAMNASATRSQRIARAIRDTPFPKDGSAWRCVGACGMGRRFPGWVERDSSVILQQVWRLDHTFRRFPMYH